MKGLGKIAQLPRKLREELNGRLRETEDDAATADWLNSLGETKSQTMPISEDQVTEWRSTGYREWLAGQKALESLAEMVAEGGEWKTRLGGSITDAVADWLAPQYVLAAREKLTGTDGARRWEILRAVVQDWTVLRRGDHSAARLQLDREEFEWQRANSQTEKEKEFREWLKRPEIQTELFPDAEPGLSAEAIKAMKEALSLL